MHSCRLWTAHVDCGLHMEIIKWTAHLLYVCIHVYFMFSFHKWRFTFLFFRSKWRLLNELVQFWFQITIPFQKISCHTQKPIKLSLNSKLSYRKSNQYYYYKRQSRLQVFKAKLQETTKYNLYQEKKKKKETTKYNTDKSTALSILNISGKGKKSLS